MTERPNMGVAKFDAEAFAPEVLRRQAATAAGRALMREQRRKMAGVRADFARQARQQMAEFDELIERFDDALGAREEA